MAVSEMTIGMMMSEISETETVFPAACVFATTISPQYGFRSPSVVSSNQSTTLLFPIILSVSELFNCSLTVCPSFTPANSVSPIKTFWLVSRAMSYPAGKVKSSVTLSPLYIVLISAMIDFD